MGSNVEGAKKINPITKAEETDKTIKRSSSSSDENIGSQSERGLSRFASEQSEGDLCTNLKLPISQDFKELEPMSSNVKTIKDENLERMRTGSHLVLNFRNNSFTGWN